MEHSRARSAGCLVAQLQELALVRRRHPVQAQLLTFVDRDVCGRHGFILRQLRRRDGKFQFVDGLLVAAQPALHAAGVRALLDPQRVEGGLKGGLRGNKETIDKLELTIAATQLAQDEAVAAAHVAVDKGQRLRLHGVASAHESKLLELRIVAGAEYANIIKPPSLSEGARQAKRGVREGIAQGHHGQPPHRQAQQRTGETPPAHAHARHLRDVSAGRGAHPRVRQARVDASGGGASQRCGGALGASDAERPRTKIRCFRSCTR